LRPHTPRQIFPQKTGSRSGRWRRCHNDAETAAASFDAYAISFRRNSWSCVQRCLFSNGKNLKLEFGEAALSNGSDILHRTVRQLSSDRRSLEGMSALPCQSKFVFIQNRHLNFLTISSAFYARSDVSHRKPARNSTSSTPCSHSFSHGFMTCPALFLLLSALF
jgi:hypothetical protein